MEILIKNMKLKHFLILVFLLLNTIGYSQNILDKQIVLFDFDNNATDQFGKVKCPNATTMEYVTCRKGGNTQSLILSGGKPSFEINDTTVLNLKYYPNISISFWLKSSGKGNIAMFSNDSSISNGGWILGINNAGNLIFNVCPATKGKQAMLTSKQTIPSSKWLHYTITIEKSKSIGLYINGERDTTLALKKSLSFDQISKLLIGGKNLNAKSDFEIDDLRIFDGAVNNDDAKKIFKLGSSLNQIEFDLGKPNSAKNSCTLQFELSPDGEKVLIENKGSKNTEGFVFKFYDNKLNLITETPGNQKNYELNYSTFNRQPVFFLAVIDPKGFVVQIYQIHLTY